MQGCDTRSATRAAAAEAHADHAEAALAVCLQQPSFRGPDGRVAIILLAVSKRLAALVARCCGGALALQTRVVAKPAQAGALAAWLSHHGTLLAELELDMSWSGHSAVCVLEQLPRSIMHLTLDGWDAAAVAAQPAAAFARAFSRQSMQLRSLTLPPRWHDQAATVLPALATLRQLTSLAMWVPAGDASQLPVQHLPAQLQQLELLGPAWSTAALPWLALEHVTGLTRLSMRRACVDGGVLPHGLRLLAAANVSSVAPLQPLEQLTALQLDTCSIDIASAEQLRQLSTLRRLEQLSVRALRAYQADLSDALAALAVLPLTHLSVLKQKLTAACLARLGDCTHLTSLELCNFDLAADGATPEQLAAAVARLTALQRMQLQSEGSPPAGAAGWWAPLCKVLVRLPRLTACDLHLPDLGPAAAHLAAATQLTELHVCCGGLDDGGLATVCSGLTGLRHLDVSYNRLLTDACLACIAAMPRLMLLDLHGTGVTDNGVQQLCASRPSLQVQRL